MADPASVDPRDSAHLAPVSAGPPGDDVLRRALRKAVAVRVAGYRQDDRFAAYSVAALCERVVAVPTPPRALPEGWWSAGRVLDDLGGVEWRVRVHPGRRVLRMTPRTLPEPRIPVPARHADGRYYDGARRRWVLPTGEAIAGDAVAGDASDSPPPA